MLEIEAQALVEGAQRAPMDAQQRFGVAQAAGAHRPSIGHREGHLAGAPIQDGRPATHAVTQLRAQAQCIERAQLEQRAQPCVDPTGCRDGPQRRERESEQPASVRAGAALRRQPVEQLEQVAAEREASRLPAQRRESLDQRRLLEAREPGRAPALHLHAQVIEQVEGAGEAAHAAPGALRDRGEAPRVGHQQMHDAIGLAKVDRPQHQRLGRRVRHGTGDLAAQPRLLARARPLSAQPAQRCRDGRRRDRCPRSGRRTPGWQGARGRALRGARPPRGPAGSAASAARTALSRAAPPRLPAAPGADGSRRRRGRARAHSATVRTKPRTKPSGVPSKAPASSRSSERRGIRVRFASSSIETPRRRRCRAR